MCRRTTTTSEGSIRCRAIMWNGVPRRPACWHEPISLFPLPTHHQKPQFGRSPIAHGLPLSLSLNPLVLAPTCFLIQHRYHFSPYVHVSLVQHQVFISSRIPHESPYPPPSPKPWKRLLETHLPQPLKIDTSLPLGAQIGCHLDTIG
jgi:hypothetical protein